MLKRKLNYTLSWFPGSDYDDMFPSLINNTFDVVIGDVVISPARSQQVRFAQPFITTGFILAIPTTVEAELKPWSFLSPLTYGVWLVLGGFFFFGAFVIYFLEHEEVSKRGLLRGVLDVLSFAFNTPWVPGFSEINITRPLARIFMFIWLAGLFIILSAYQANLVSFLTVSRVASQINSLADIGSVKTGAWSDGTPTAPDAYLRERGTILINTTSSHVEHGILIHDHRSRYTFAFAF